MSVSSILKKKCGVSVKEALRSCPELKKYTLTKGKIDLGNSRALLLYNQIILRTLMGLDFEVPEGYLIPTICSRFEFLKFVLQENPEYILEIGTGASAILALMLGRMGISVTATEVDEGAYQSALDNIQKANLTDKIELLKSEGQILQDLISDISIFNVIICNPPQYDLKYYQEQFSSNRGFVGKYNELVGGVVGHEFIIKLLTEIRCYTSTPPVFFQLTLPKLQAKVETELVRREFQYSIVHKNIGTRKRIYFKVVLS